MELLEKNIIQDLNNGDEKVFEKVFRTYYERLVNYALTIVNDIDEAEEMVQSAFMKIWEKQGQIDIHTSIKSYLYRAVHNNCLNRLKHYKIRQEHGEKYKYQANHSMGDASEKFIGKELEKMMYDAIESMPMQCKTAFKLSRYENMTYAEISNHMNISIKTVENHMLKALKFLKEKFKDYLPLILYLLIINN